MAGTGDDIVAAFGQDIGVLPTVPEGDSSDYGTSLDDALRSQRGKRMAAVFLSVDSPITRILFDYLPGFSLFRSPNRFLFLTTLFGLAGAGSWAQELFRRFLRRVLNSSTTSFSRRKLKS